MNTHTEHIAYAYKISWYRTDEIIATLRDLAQSLYTACDTLWIPIRQEMDLLECELNKRARLGAKAA